MPSPKLKQFDVTVTRQFPSGAYECSAIWSGYRQKKVFYGYTKREAIRLFVAEINERGEVL